MRAQMALRRGRRKPIALPKAVRPLIGRAAHHTGGRGGIGRRAALRSLWGNPWKFESSRPHHPASPFRASQDEHQVAKQTCPSTRNARVALPARAWPSKEWALASGHAFADRRSVGVCRYVKDRAAPMIPNVGPSMDFGLGETADAIRETTARFAADQIAPLAARDRRDQRLPAPALAADGRAGPARDHRRGGVRRPGAGLPRACGGHGGGLPRLGLGRASATAPTPTSA